MLHNDTELFKELVFRAADSKGINPGIVEKDHYVTVFLKSLVAKQPQLILKGGTSLSKCYKLIQRISEDIDLNLDCDQKPTEGQRRKLKACIIATIDDFGFSLTNPDQIRSRRDFNKYVIDYPSAFEFANLKQCLIVETSVFLRSFPSVKMTATSLIYDYLYEQDRQDVIKQYSLEPFELQVQDIRRTFIDKLFALGDYYLSGRVTEHSRHIYDLYKLYDVVTIDDSLKELFSIVREERSGHYMCYSAQQNIDLKALLQKIIAEDAYKSDYEAITSYLLYEKLPYNVAVQALQKIIDSPLFTKP